MEETVGLHDVPGAGDGESSEMTREAFSRERLEERSSATETTEGGPDRTARKGGSYASGRDGPQRPAVLAGGRVSGARGGVPGFGAVRSGVSWAATGAARRDPRLGGRGEASRCMRGALLVLGREAEASASPRRCVWGFTV